MNTSAQLIIITRLLGLMIAPCDQFQIRLKGASRAEIMLMKYDDTFLRNGLYNKRLSWTCGLAKLWLAGKLILSCYCFKWNMFTFN